LQPVSETGERTPIRTTKSDKFMTWSRFDAQEENELSVLWKEVCPVGDKIGDRQEVDRCSIPAKIQAGRAAPSNKTVKILRV
jgi:hypothetical protein